MEILKFAIERTCYQHWALYIGGGYVVHLAPPSEVANAGAQSLMSVVADRAVVKKELLKDVVGNSNWRVDNLLDKEYEPRSTCVVIEEAKAWVGRVMRYNVISWNCEHFVTNLRYGKPESRQVGLPVVLAGLLLLLGPLSSAAALPSVPGALRINLDVREDMPVTAQPAQLDEAPAG
uniref:Retinoic acid receptor responder 3-like n=1 Tax=Cynoglossus semilaevis TaxID=244447 RepID=A0A3P8VA48_CYNSE